MKVIFLSLLINPFFTIFVITFFINIWYIYKYLKVYQLNIINKIKKDYKKQLKKHFKIFIRKKKKKTDNMVINVTKISQKMKNKSLSSVENSIIEWEKTLGYNYNNLKSSFEAIELLQKALKSSFKWKK